MGISTPYATKLERISPGTLLAVLDEADQVLVRRLAERYRFTHQELRKVAQAVRDLQMWRESSFAEWWSHAEAGAPGKGRERKIFILHRLDLHLEELAHREKVYPADGLDSPPGRQVRLEEKSTQGEIFGLCPAYSEETVCCGLHTIDAVRGCPFACSYCTIQTFYDETAELEADLASQLTRLELDPDRRYHIGTGQASDSLVWGNRGGMLDSLLAFAERSPNVLLELKTKSANIRPLLERPVPRNLVCSWSLNSEAIIKNEEHATASLSRRLAAARSAADQGLRIAFHVHPMVYYEGWKPEYAELATRVMDSFDASEVSFISFGAVTLIKPVVKQIRKRGGDTKILQMPLVADHHGKLTYPDHIKLQLFQHLYGAFENWHEAVFFYLCMETAAIWQKVLGQAYPTNELFEQDFLDRCLP